VTVPYAAHIQLFLLKMSTWYSKHVEENIWRINNIKCITLVFCMIIYVWCISCASCMCVQCLSCSVKFLLRTWSAWCAWWRSWLRHCATSRNVAGSIPDGVTVTFHWHNPSGRTVALRGRLTLEQKWVPGERTVEKFCPCKKLIIVLRSYMAKYGRRLEMWFVSENLSFNLNC